ncbi:MAG: sugar-binding domain-containing protein [Verrucomicrobiota bacterium]
MYPRILSLALVILSMGLVGPAPAIAALANGRSEVSLNGVWDFYPEGRTNRFDIRVPSFWDAPQDYNYPTNWAYLRHGVYRKSFAVPPAMRDQLIYLNIERVSVIAKVFVNGTQVGGEDANGYLMMQLPYDLDITKLVKLDGPNQLEVQVWGGKSMVHGDDSQDKLIEAKEGDFPPETKVDGRFLYPYCVDHWDGRRGLNSDVSLVSRPKTHVADVFVIPNLHKNGNPADDEITIRLTLANCDSKSHKVQVQNQATLVGGTLGKSFEPLVVTLPPDSTMEVTVQNNRWPDAQYWWPHDPKLYVLKTELVDKDTPVDMVKTRFGFREFYVNGDHYELNGIRANLRGDAYEFSWSKAYRHGPSTGPVLSTKELIPQMQVELLREYAALNHNMLRPHKASAFKGLYDLCDETGMMVLDEAPFWETWVRTDERSKPYYESWVRRWIKARRNHPCIMAWIGANECWFGATGVISVNAIRMMDTSRPSFHEDPWGSGIHHDDLSEPYEGDEDCRHYTGGYPIKKLNTPDLYDVYRANARKPTGEGESFFPEGFPLMNPDGTFISTLTNRASARGEFGNPDMVSQAQWLRAVCRMFRAMRYAEISDARLYADWMLNFDPIEADIPLAWKDLSAPGIKTDILHRPIINVFSGQYPRVRYNPAREYYRNSFAAVAVFDKEGDRQNRIGASPIVFNGNDELTRTLVVYNDEFTDGTDITVNWTAEASNPHSGAAEVLQRGRFTIPVPYGAKREQLVKFDLSKHLTGGRWLNLVLTATKSGAERFSETNRLGALTSVPAPKLAISPRVIDLGEIAAAGTNQWHCVRLINTGGGASEPWTLSVSGEGVFFNHTNGNLRVEQEIYFQVDPAMLRSGSQSREVRVTGASSSTDTFYIKFKR